MSLVIDERKEIERKNMANREGGRQKERKKERKKERNERTWQIANSWRE